MDKIGTIFRTSNYNIFKTLHGNRNVSNARVEKIIQSIDKVGYIMSPLIVNEKMEIIDGQGRYNALKKLGLPIDYIIVKGIGIEECRQMNINQSNWTVLEFIESYADEGNTSYKFLLNLYKQYKRLGITVVYNALSGLSAIDSEKIKIGKFSCTEDDYNNAIKILEYEQKFIDIVKKIKGRADYIYIAIGFCYLHDDVDNDVLLKKFLERGENISSPSNIEQALDEISDIYNWRLRGGKVYLSTDYKKSMDKKYSWYSKKYLSDRVRHYL